MNDGNGTDPRAPLRRRLAFPMSSGIALAKNLTGFRRYRRDGEWVDVRYNGMSLRFHDPTKQGDWSGIYRFGAYDWLPVEGKVVVDVGAAIGDSAMYFLHRGAASVQCWETNSAFRASLGLNLRDNWVDEDGIVGDSARIMGHAGSIAEIVSQVPDHDTRAVMKMDIEGAEYDLFERADPYDIRRFSHIVIEYHYGAARLRSTLERCGFEVNWSGPMSQANGMRMGLMRATRVGP